MKPVEEMTAEELDAELSASPVEPIKPARNPNGTVPGDYQYNGKPEDTETQFWPGMGGQMTSYLKGAGRMLGVTSPEEAKEHGATMAKLRKEPLGGAGAMAGNAAVSAAAPWFKGLSLPGIAGNALVGGGMEALSDYGEGKSGADAALEGGVRGALGTAAGNVALNAAGKLANAGLSKAGATGRWKSPEDKYIYEFAKEKGIDLRPGDLARTGLTRALENFHPLNSDPKLASQAGQIEAALFSDGNKLLDGFKRVKDQIDVGNQKLWEPVYKMAEQPTVTAVRPIALRNSLTDVLQKYPNMLNKVDNVQLRSTLADVVAAPTANKLPRLSFQQVRELQQSIGPEVEKLKMQALNGTITRDEASSMSKLYGALHDDLARWGEHGSNQKVYKLYKDVNETYKKDFLPFYNNDVIRTWQRGGYDDGHHEKLLTDLLAPARRSQTDRLLWYTGQLDHDTTGYIEMLRLADRGAKHLVKEAPEPSSSIGVTSLFSPKLAAARLMGHQATSSNKLTPLYGLRADFGDGALSQAARQGLLGGSGLSGQEIFGRKPQR